MEKGLDRKLVNLVVNQNCALNPMSGEKTINIGNVLFLGTIWEQNIIFYRTVLFKKGHEANRHWEQFKFRKTR